jgi:hypothetical protein
MRSEASSDAEAVLRFERLSEKGLFEKGGLNLSHAQAKAVESAKNRASNYRHRGFAQARSGRGPGGWG